MGKYTSMTRQKETPRVRGVHPIMKGLGCLIFVIVPVLAYGASVILVNLGVQRGWPLPPNWLGYPVVPPLLWRLSGLAPILALIQGQANLVANLVFTAGISIAIGSVMGVFFGYIYKFFGPSPYGPTDSPPIRVSVKRYKR